MLSPTPILHDPPSLLGDVRQALSLHPELVSFPRHLATLLEADETAVRKCLDVLRVEDEVLA